MSPDTTHKTCRFCPHETEKHNLTVGCPSCDCMATAGEARFRGYDDPFFGPKKRHKTSHDHERSQLFPYNSSVGKGWYCYSCGGDVPLAEAVLLIFPKQVEAAVDGALDAHSLKRLAQLGVTFQQANLVMREYLTTQIAKTGVQ